VCFCGNIGRFCSVLFLVEQGKVYEGLGYSPYVFITYGIWHLFVEDSFWLFPPRFYVVLCELLSPDMKWLFKMMILKDFF
jgi:hypothetical protein